jgi:hypothetical protein
VAIVQQQSAGVQAWGRAVQRAVATAQRAVCSGDGAQRAAAIVQRQWLLSALLLSSLFSLLSSSAPQAAGREILAAVERGRLEAKAGEINTTAIR